MINNLFPVSRSAADPTAVGLGRRGRAHPRENGFDPVQHEQLRDDLQRGRIGLARNRLPVDTDIRDVDDDDLIDARTRGQAAPASPRPGAIADGEVAVVTLAARRRQPLDDRRGRGQGGQPVRHARRQAPQLPGDPPGQDPTRRRRASAPSIPHVVTTSYLTHRAIERHLERTGNYGHDGPVYLSRGQSIGQRLVPMARDLTFLWEEQSHETLDENKQKVREAGRRAILDWARSKGEGTDYADNVPVQRFNPPGHFYEVPNLLRNGTLARLARPTTRTSAG